MANKKITDLPSASLPLNDTDLMEVVQGGVNKKAPKSEVTSVSQAQLTAGLATKQNTLVSGTNIKTINSSSILGSGNLNIGGTPFGETTGTNTYGVNFSPAITSYEDSRPYHIRVGNASTGAVTLNFNSLGPRKLYKSNGVQAGSGDLLAGVNYLVAYNSSLDGGVGGLSIVNIIQQSLDARLITANIVKRETPGGSINGSNTAFTVAFPLIAGSEELFRNGILQDITTSYTISGQNITMIVAPETGDSLKINYIKS